MTHAVSSLVSALLDLVVFDSEGIALGRWLVVSEADALEAQATDLGYASYAELCGDGLGRGWEASPATGDEPWWLRPVAWQRG